MVNKKEKGGVSIQSVDKENDYQLLYKWLHRPHVIRWWGDPEKNIQDLTKPALNGGEALIVYNKTRVGYMRWAKPTKDELDDAKIYDLPDAIVDIDIAIGELNYIGHGIGTQALRLLVTRLKSTKLAMITICTSIYNGVALKSFERVGFVRNRIFTDAEYGEMWLLAIDLQNNKST